MNQDFSNEEKLERQEKIERQVVIALYVIRNMLCQTILVSSYELENHRV